MELILGLLLAGVLLLGSEVFVPSGIVGSIGGLCLLAGIILAFQQFGPFGGLAAGVGSLVAVFIVIFLQLKLLPKTRAGKRMFNQSASSGKAVDTGAATAVELVGKSGRTLTICAPTGLVEIEGKQHEASSLDGLLQAGEAILVAGRDSYKLLVKKTPAA